MLLDQRTRRGVAFVCYENSRGEIDPVGTCFFVGAPHGLPERDGAGFTWRYQRYAVTAKHLVVGQPNLYIRIQRSDHNDAYEDIPVARDAWVTHAEADVAALRWDEPSTYHRHIRNDELVSDEDLSESHFGGRTREIDAGAWLFFVGLFATALDIEGSRSWSPSRPIARFGRLAFNRGEEKVPMRQGDVVTWHDAYLAEARSWGGQSGSPCYIYFQEGHDRAYMTDDPTHERSFLPGFGRLLGLVSAHYEVNGPIEIHGDLGVEAATARLNSGIAMITPAQYITELLMNAEYGLVTEREERARREASEANAQRS